MISRTIAFIAGACAALSATAASAESADWYRGGWKTETGNPRIYEFVTRDRAVTGYTCTQCADGTTLASLSGTFDEAGGIAFTVRHLNLDGSLVAAENLTAKLSHGKLVVSGGQGEQVTIKDLRGPTPGAYFQSILPPDAPPVPILKPAGGGAGGPPPPYVQPATWRQLTEADVAGVWIGFGVGMEKQYFVIRRDGDRLFGLACGRCDNPYTHGSLENFRITGDVLEFDIVHEDWGDGKVLPFNRHVKANIAMNELHMDARRPDQSGPGIVASLIGPIAIEATRGNIYLP
ncbi:MAG: hypothetical protein P0Y56_05790 [Candidatus Andeanibacterium colombiense]|uniref:Uncharacterized protein n=1 Tax=Candidatus Andeanibacterium colombiense TaxID=3121345 RepID=A0AAJ5X8P0_9SPHN|nr:MAG: hypothetical protein P0Y56_05790 [Sphingomonadaceae bacterium]